MSYPQVPRNRQARLIMANSSFFSAIVDSVVFSDMSLSLLNTSHSVKQIITEEDTRFMRTD